MYARRFLENFTSLMGSHTPPMFTVILDKGFEFSPKPLDASEKYSLQCILNDAAYTCNFEQKECFHNAQMLVLAEDTSLEDLEHSIQYFEGYFIRESLPIPIHHGWIAINGKVVDLTIRQAIETPSISGFEDRAIGEYPSDVHYIGIEIDKQDVLDRLRDSSETHTILDDWNPKYRHLRDKYLKPRSNPKLKRFKQRLEDHSSEANFESPIWFRGARGHGKNMGVGFGAMGLGLYLVKNQSIAQEYADNLQGYVLKYFVNMDIDVLDASSPLFYECLQFAVGEATLHPAVKTQLVDLLDDENIVGFYQKYYQFLSGYDQFESALASCVKRKGFRGVYSDDEYFGLVLYYPEEDALPFFKLV